MQFYKALNILAALAALSSTVTANTTNPFSGVYNLTSLTSRQPNGTITLPLGPSPYGRIILHPSFIFVNQFNAQNIPQFASGDRLTGTDAENRAVVQGTIGNSGTYKVDENGDWLEVTLECSTFPNVIGLVRGRDRLVFEVVEGGLRETIRNGEGDDQVVDTYEWQRLA